MSDAYLECGHTELLSWRGWRFKGSWGAPGSLGGFFQACGPKTFLRSYCDPMLLALHLVSGLSGVLIRWQSVKRSDGYVTLGLAAGTGGLRVAGTVS